MDSSSALAVAAAASSRSVELAIACAWRNAGIGIAKYCTIKPSQGRVKAFGCDEFLVGLYWMNVALLVKVLWNGIIVCVLWDFLDDQTDFFRLGAVCRSSSAACRSRLEWWTEGVAYLIQMQAWNPRLFHWIQLVPEWEESVIHMSFLGFRVSRIMGPLSEGELLAEFLAEVDVERMAQWMEAECCMPGMSPVWERWAETP